MSLKDAKLLHQEDKINPYMFNCTSMLFSLHLLAIIARKDGLYFVCVLYLILVSEGIYYISKYDYNHVRNSIYALIFLFQIETFFFTKKK
jgi:hypothetical protein